MANLKNITDLPVAESADGLNLIVNDNGVAKQIAASEVGAQADWNVMDENSPAFVKNKPTVVSSWNELADKPFSEEEDIIVEKTKLEFYESNHKGVSDAKTPIEIDIIEGQTYLVNIDGISYIMVGKHENYYGAHYWYIGNGSMLTSSFDDSGDTFAIAKVYDDVDGDWYTTKFYGDDSRTITISKLIIKKLDAKYLPTEEWDLDIEITQTWDPSSGDPICSHVVNHINTFESIKNKILNGQVVSGKFKIKSQNDIDSPFYTLFGTLTHAGHYPINSFGDGFPEHIYLFSIAGFGAYVILLPDDTIAEVGFD